MSAPLDGLASAIASHLPPARATRSAPPPGVSLWLYSGREAADTWRRTRDLVRSIRPQGVILHNNPDPGDRSTIEAIVAEGWPLWLAVLGNDLVALDDNAARKLAETWAARARAWGAKGLIFNCEGASRPGRPGWKPGQGRTAAQLDTLAAAVMDGANEEADGAIAVGWSSHDVARSHPLPWGPALQRADVHVPQEYVDKGKDDQGRDYPPTTLREALWRANLGRSRELTATPSDPDGKPGWVELAAAGTIPARCAPGGAGFWPAHQLHSTRPEAALALALRSPSTAWWAIDGSMDVAGIEAVRVSVEVYRQGLPTDVRALQRRVGAEPDGIMGPKTYAAVRAFVGTP